jgi:hypothetical protein
MAATRQLIAPCGLDCSICPLQATTLSGGEPVGLFATLIKLGAITKAEMPGEASQGLCCPTCRGDRVLQWSATCRIRQCCVDDKGLEYCSECDGFPCERLRDWAMSSTRCADALNRLHSMRDGVTPRSPRGLT